jgi:hypothetical protein
MRGSSGAQQHVVDVYRSSGDKTAGREENIDADVQLNLLPAIVDKPPHELPPPKTRAVH